ncbi:hypothetical protein ACWKWU_09490 [Chitinophaga lutea]
MKVHKKIYTLLLLGFLGLAGRAQAQQQQQQEGERYQDYFQVKAIPDTTKIRIGEPIKIDITAKVMLYALKGANIKVAFPNLPDSLNHIEIVDRGKLDTIGSNEQQRLFRATMTVTSFDSGRWEMPPMKFEVYSMTDGSYDSVFTEPFFIDVNTVAVDTTQAFKPIKDVRRAPINIFDYWPWLLAVFLIVSLTVIYFAYWHKRRPKAPPAPPKPSKTPFEAALAELQRIGREKPWNTDVKAYYTDLTDVLRQYFEQQFKIPALEQTSAELLQNIKPVTILNQQRDKLQRILTVADLAKFAKMQPTPEEHEACLREAIDIVEWTRASVTAAESKEESNNATT